MQRYTVYLYLETALHVSVGTSTHHQERIQLYLQHLVIVTPLLLSVAIVECPFTLSVTLSDFTVWRHAWRKNWVNCAGLTDNSGGLRTVISSRLSHKELRSLLRESHIFLSLSADITMASPQGTSVSSNSFSRWTSHDIFLFKYHFLLHILRFLFFFLDNLMADVASKQQTTSLFLSNIVTRTRRHTELTEKLTNLMGNVCCAREHSVQIFVQFLFYTIKLHSLT
jgi:hypothetical protein